MNPQMSGRCRSTLLSLFVCIFRIQFMENKVQLCGPHQPRSYHFEFFVDNLDFTFMKNLEALTQKLDYFLQI